MRGHRVPDVIDDRIAAFVPQLALELDAGERWTSVEGSMLSADISGFTALSEKLAGKGRAGAEEITELVNECFVSLMDAAYRYGGEVLKFGGDAILVLFRGDDHAGLCGDAALAMQTALADSRAARRANLSMSVGASTGPFDVFVAGSGVRELLVTGRGPTEVVRLEGVASSGETLVAPSIADALPPTAAAGQHDGGVVLTGAPREPGERDLGRPAPVGDLTRFVPPQVLEQLEAFADLGGEHRLVSVGFAMVSGISPAIARHGIEHVTDALHTFVDEVVDRSAPFGVTLLHTDIATDGFKCILAAGAPVNPGDPSDAMLHAALAIAEIDVPFEIRLGVQTGRVFAGFLGAPYRRTYTVMGDAVNTAARLLGAAGDREVVATSELVGDTRALFRSQRLPPVLAKGKAEPIEAERVVEATDEVRRAASPTTLYGRREELAVLARAVGELGEIVDLVGPAGAGKSRLVDAAWDDAEGLRTFRAACTPYGSASPYSLFRALLRGGTGIDVAAAPEDAGHRLAGLVAEVVPDLAPMLPLLAVPFGATVPPTPEASAIDPQHRRLRIHDAVLRLLDAAVTGPALLVLEDMHWADEASGDLANYLLRAATGRRWSAIVTRRPTGVWEPAPDLADVVRIEVAPLGDADIRGLCIEASHRPLPDHDLDAIVARAAGNPLFAIELARAVAAGTVSEIPDSVEALIAQRIDRLAPDDRHLVRVASVFGNRFDGEDLAAIVGAGAVEQLTTGVRIDDLLERHEAGEWAFTHSLYRDVAYAGLPFRQRRELHREIGCLLEASGTDRVDLPALLSLHFEEAGDRDRVWRYATVAGRRAVDQHAFVDASVVFERAHRAGSRLRDVPAEERIDVGVQLAELQAVIGNYDRAREVLGGVRRLVSRPAAEADVMRRLGIIAEREGRLTQALRWYTRALGQIPSRTSDPDELTARALTLLARAGILHRRGENHECARLSHEALADAERAQDDGTRAVAFERLHVAHVYTRSRYADQYAAAALDAYERADDLPGQVKVLNNQGIHRYFRGDWTAANECYERAARLGERAGVVVDGGSAALNSGEVLSDQGHWDRALTMFRDARRNWEAVGYATGVAVARLYEGVALMRLEAFEDARTSMKEAVSELRALTATDLVVDAESRLAELDLAEGNPAALDATRAVLRRVEPTSALGLRVRRHAALARAASDDVAGAVTDLTGLLDDTTDAVFDRAMVLAALVRLAETEGVAAVGADPDTVASWQGECNEITEALGIVRLPAT